VRAAFPLTLLLLASCASSAVGAGAAPLTGTWRVDSVAGAAAFDTARTELVFAADGSVSTTIGCNRMAGAPQIDGTRLRFGPLATTRMACAQPLMVLESRYAAALAATRSYRIEASTLRLLDEAGAEQVVSSRVR
jgi:heat shock protein HslJ